MPIRIYIAWPAAGDDVVIATKFGNTFDEPTRNLTGIDVSPTGSVMDILPEDVQSLIIGVRPGQDHWTITF